MMKRTVRILLIALPAVIIGIQFIPRDHNNGVMGQADDISKVVPVPANIGAVLQKSCNDCHSNHTHYPWYAQIQPVRYMLDKHIREGKDELNFNEFASYTARRQRSKLRAIGQSLSEGSMPLSSYTLIHRDAILSSHDKELLQQWAKAASDSLSLKD